MNTSFESDIPAPSCDSVKEKSLIRVLDKHALYLAIAGLVAGFGARANAVVQDKPAVIESKVSDTHRVPAQGRKIPEPNPPRFPDAIDTIPQPSRVHAEATATPEQYISAKKKSQQKISNQPIKNRF